MKSAVDLELNTEVAILYTLASIDPRAVPERFAVGTEHFFAQNDGSLLREEVTVLYCCPRGQSGTKRTILLSHSDCVWGISRQ